MAALNSDPGNPDWPVIEGVRNIFELKYSRELEIKAFEHKSQVSQKFLELQRVQEIQEFQELHWDRVISPLSDPEDYMDTLVVARDRMMHRTFYRAYHPDPATIGQLRTRLESNSSSGESEGSEGSLVFEEPGGIKILVFGATWCKTCAHVKAIFTHITDDVGSPDLHVYFLDGAKRMFGSPAWDTKWDSESPPEFRDPRFRVRTIPTTFVFGPAGHCIGKVEKFPPDGQLFEAYLAALF